MQEFKGLSTPEVNIRIEKGQTNLVKSQINRTIPQILRANILTRFNAIILALAIIAFIVSGSIFETLFGLVLLVNTSVGIFQELHARKLLKKITIAVSPKITVIRDGKPKKIPEDQIVLDDTVILETGDAVPIDGTILHSENLEIDEALLTGESDPVFKAPGKAVLSGSIVTSGQGIIQVTKVGDQTYSAKLTAKAKQFQQVPSELIRSTNLLLKYISRALIIIAPILFLGQLRAESGDWQQAAIRSITAIVGMIPEGLVLLTSAAFLLSIVKLVQQKTLIQQLPAVEGLARVNTLLLDKTGTLTTGEITLDQIEYLTPDQSKPQKALAALMNLSTSPTNTAILSGLKNITPLKTTSATPFNSTRKYSSITSEGATYTLGAPEIVLKNHPEIAAKAAEIASTGKRVLALTSKKPLALITLTENIRKDARQTLKYFAEQNVDIKIISGDNPLTVLSIAKQVGIPDAKTFDARELPEAPFVKAGA